MYTPHKNFAEVWKKTRRWCIIDPVHSRIVHCKAIPQRKCMCFLFSDDEFSATALLSEESRIKNTYTDGAKLRRCIKYTCPNKLCND